MSGMHFLVGIATNDYVILAADKASFAYGAILADSGISTFHYCHDDFLSQ